MKFMHSNVEDYNEGAFLNACHNVCFLPSKTIFG